MNPQLEERIAQFRKMATDDPDNELGHFRLGQLYMEAGKYDDAVASFRRTLELSPEFSRVFQLLGQSLVHLDRKDEATDVLTRGFRIADDRGDNLPRDEMAKLLRELDRPVPETRPSSVHVRGVDGGFRCQRPGCMAGAHAQQLPKPPINDDLGRQIHERVCADCWDYWLKNLSIKVINEMRLDLSNEKHVEIYDQMMRETLGLT